MGQYMTAEAAAELDASEPGAPGAGSYTLAALLPPVGIILAIIAFARNHLGPGFALSLESTVAAYAWFFVAAVVLAASGA